MRALSAGPAACHSGPTHVSTAERKPWMGQESVSSLKWWHNSDALVIGLCFLTQDHWKSPEATCMLQVRALRILMHTLQRPCCVPDWCVHCAGWDGGPCRLVCWPARLGDLPGQAESGTGFSSDRALVVAAADERMCMLQEDNARVQAFCTYSLPSRGLGLLVALAQHLKACVDADHASQLSAWSPAPASSEGTGSRRLRRWALYCCLSAA